MTERDKAWSLLEAHNREEMHLKHALAVEGALRHFAARAGEAVELWGLVGLLHDLDWEETPDRHGLEGARWLEEAGFADVRTWGDGKLRRPVPGEDRVYFTCIRK